MTQITVMMMLTKIMTMTVVLTSMQGNGRMKLMCGKSNDGRGQSGQKDLSIRSQCLNDCPSYKNWLTI